MTVQLGFGVITPIKTLAVKQVTQPRPAGLQAEPKFSGIFIHDNMTADGFPYGFPRFPLTSAALLASLIVGSLVTAIAMPGHTLKNQTSTSVVTAAMDTATEVKTQASEQQLNTAQFMEKFKEAYQQQLKNWRFERQMLFKQPASMTQKEYSITLNTIHSLNTCTQDPSAITSATRGIEKVNLWIDQVAKPHVGEQTAEALKAFAKQEVKEGQFTSAEKAAIRGKNFKLASIMVAVATIAGLGLDGMIFGAFQKDNYE